MLIEFLIMGMFAQTQMPVDQKGYPIPPPTVNSPIKTAPGTQPPIVFGGPGGRDTPPTSPSLCGPIAPQQLTLTPVNSLGKCDNTKSARLPASDGQVYCAPVQRQKPVNCVTGLSSSGPPGAPPGSSGNSAPGVAVRK